MEEKSTKYPIFNIDINDIKLSSSPQDDYQRLFFATLFEKFYQNSDSNLSLNDLFNQQLRFKPNIYKSSLAKNFECPEYLTEVAHMKYLKQKNIDKKNAEIATAEKLAAKLLEDPDYKHKPQKRKSIVKKDKGNENLKCFEYKLPDLKIYLNDSSNEYVNKNAEHVKSEDINTTSEHKFEITQETLNKIPNNIRENLGINDVNCKKRLLDANVAYDNTPLRKNDSGTTTTTDDDNSQESSVTTEDGNIVVNTLTKNQQFKVTKIYHNDASNNKLISKNNTVLWEHDTGFVFLTGIWRLYQDIIRGLILCQRRDASKEENIAIRDKCIREYDYISSFAFYESISLDANDSSFIKNYFKDQDQNGRTRKRRSVTNQNSSYLANIGIHGSRPQKNSNSNSNGNNTGSNDISYSDLHWNEISDQLCELVRNDFKDHLINEQHIPIDHINVDGKNINDLGKRIRGGFIKIQGTWQPMRVAKRMCYRFCYPIRYLLIPVFGPDFVEECEKWYKAIEQQAKLMMDERKRTGLMGPLRSKRSGRRNSPKTSNTSSPKTKRKISITAGVEPTNKKPTLRNPFSDNGTIATSPEEIISPETVSQGSPGSVVDKNNLPKVYISNTRQRGIQSLPSIKGIMDSISDYSPQIGHIPPGQFFVRGRNSVPNVHFAPYDHVSYYQTQPIGPLTINQQQPNYLPPPLDQSAMVDPGRRLSFENIRTPLPTDRYNLNKPTTTSHTSGNNSQRNSYHASSLGTPKTPDVNVLSAAANLYNTGGHRYAYPPTVRVTQHDQNKMYDFAPNTHISYIGTPKLSNISRTVPHSADQGGTSSIPRSYNRTQLPRLVQPYSNGQQYQNTSYSPQGQVQVQYQQPQLRVSPSQQQQQQQQQQRFQPPQIQMARYYQQVPQYQQLPSQQRQQQNQGLQQQQSPQYGQYYHYLQTNHMKFQQQ